MTIAIVAIARPGNYIVSVSDRMISYDDVTQAEDNAALKARRVAGKWGVTFSADDARLFYPIIDKLIERINDEERNNHNDFSMEEMSNYITTAYQEVFQSEFAARFLSRLRIKTVEEFRKFGRAELGDVVFHELYKELSKFELGISLLVFGYDAENLPCIFEVESPGRAIDHNLLGYAVIGSGYWMASASLRRRPLTRDLPSLIYRLLEAKFSAETARGVGRSTAVLTFKPDAYGDTGLLRTHEVEQIRISFEETLKTPIPEDALNVINISKAVAHLMATPQLVEEKSDKPPSTEAESSS